MGGQLVTYMRRQEQRHIHEIQQETKVISPETTSIGQSIQIYQSDTEFDSDGSTEFDDLRESDYPHDELQQLPGDELDEDSAY